MAKPKKDRLKESRIHIDLENLVSELERFLDEVDALVTSLEGA